ncbi:MAG: hypothetical protein M3O06_00385, partial [Pseudomonadota bacterium]|nr:hypothetical protein [Pseudomonadota bacterium]
MMNCKLILATAALTFASLTEVHGAMPVANAGPEAELPTERLGSIAFVNSCNSEVQSKFNRGVALLHDFWYTEAERQFREIAKADPRCGMARWGVAMSQFQQIWGRPDKQEIEIAWSELSRAQSPAAKSARERAYIAALSAFFRPDSKEYPARIADYSQAMGALYGRFPKDVDAGAFYALSLLAAQDPNDTSLKSEHQAMTVLTPLYAAHPEHPGVIHYIIHACDNPSMASDGLTASQRYGKVAPSGSHAVHMPGHIFSRLGLWREDIEANLLSVTAAEAAEARGRSSIMDEPHSYDFLAYAYLQSGQEDAAHHAIDQANAVLMHLQSMPDMADGAMRDMVPYYRSELPAFYALEMRDWETAAAMQPVAGAPAYVKTLTYWARAIADGRLHRPGQARADLAGYDALTEEIGKGPDAYRLASTGQRISHGEVLAWVAFAESNKTDALALMR